MKMKCIGSGKMDLAEEIQSHLSDGWHDGNGWRNVDPASARLLSAVLAHLQRLERALIDGADWLESFQEGIMPTARDIALVADAHIMAKRLRAALTPAPDTGREL